EPPKIRDCAHIGTSTAASSKRRNQNNGVYCIASPVSERDGGTWIGKGRSLLRPMLARQSGQTSDYSGRFSSGDGPAPTPPTLRAGAPTLRAGNRRVPAGLHRHLHLGPPRA